MKAFFSAIRKMIANLTEWLSGKKKEAQPAPCQFCGDTHHRSEDCPNAAKYKLFHVDRE